MHRGADARSTAHRHAVFVPVMQLDPLIDVSDAVTEIQPLRRIENLPNPIRMDSYPVVNNLKRDPIAFHRSGDPDVDTIADPRVFEHVLDERLQHQLDRLVSDNGRIDIP